MATKWYNQQTFSASVNGREYSFYCHTTSTRNGFCHTIETLADGSWLRDTKISYINRTWERFVYETALKRAIEECPKADQAELREIIIEKKFKEEHEKCEKFLSAFQSEYNNLSERNKEILKNSPEITSEEQAEGVLGVMKMMNAFDVLLGEK